MAADPGTDNLSAYLLKMAFEVHCESQRADRTEA